MLCSSIYIFCVDNFELEDGELTLNGFIDLHQMEAEDCNGEEDDLWVTLYSMGFNESLHLDEVSIDFRFGLNVFQVVYLSSKNLVTSIKLNLN